jgi:hypothetical protein
MKAKNILLTASLCAGIGLATLVAQTGDQQQEPTPTSSPMNMMGIMNMTPAQCMAMMKQAGMSTGIIMHCAMTGRLEVDAYDPATVLAMKEHLNLTAEQQDKLRAVLEDARQRSKALLTEEQQNQLKPLQDAPKTMQEMWKQWHSKTGQQATSAMMMCPWMSQ